MDSDSGVYNKECSRVILIDGDLQVKEAVSASLNPTSSCPLYHGPGLIRLANKIFTLEQVLHILFEEEKTYPANYTGC